MGVESEFLDGRCYRLSVCVQQGTIRLKLILIVGGNFLVYRGEGTHEALLMLEIGL